MAFLIRARVAIDEVEVKEEASDAPKVLWVEFFFRVIPYPNARRAQVLECLRDRTEMLRFVVDHDESWC